METKSMAVILATCLQWQFGEGMSYSPSREELAEEIKTLLEIMEATWENGITDEAWLASIRAKIDWNPPKSLTPEQIHILMQQMLTAYSPMISKLSKGIKIPTKLS